MKLTRGAAFVAVHAVHQPVGLFLRAAYPLADTFEILFIDGGFQFERLGDMELLLQETQRCTLVEGFGAAREAELCLDLLVLLIP